MDLRDTLPKELQTLLDQSSKKLTAKETSQLAAVLHHYRNEFTCEGDKKGRTDITTHAIRLHDPTPIKQATRRLNPDDQEWVEEEVGRMLDDDIIEPSNAAWASPLVIVKKKDGARRFCIDYRKLNQVTIKDSYPLPKIEEALDALAGSMYFCSLDLASAYWQIPMDPDSMDYTTFCCRQGLFRYKVMPFGLCNAPATCERLMELMLTGLNWKKCLIYIDDILIYGTTFEDCLNNFVEVLQ